MFFTCVLSSFFWHVSTCASASICACTDTHMFHTYGHAYDMCVYCMYLCLCRSLYLYAINYQLSDVFSIGEQESAGARALMHNRVTTLVVCMLEKHHQQTLRVLNGLDWWASMLRLITLVCWLIGNCATLCAGASRGAYQSSSQRIKK